VSGCGTASIPALARRYVDVTHLTASPGSVPITVIEVTAINSTTPEFYRLAGIVRFKVTGMTINNIPVK
jgi:hypothetical protein